MAIQVCDDHPDLFLAAQYCLVIVGYPFFAALAALLAVDHQTGSVLFRAIAAMLSIVLICRWAYRGVPVLIGFAIPLFLLLWAILGWRLVWDLVINPMNVVTVIEPNQFLLLAFGATLLPAIPFIQVPSLETLRWAARGIEVLGTAALILLVFAAAREFEGGAELTRLSVEAINPISVGHLAVSVIIASWAGLTEYAEGSSGWLSRIARIFTIVFAAAIALASVSRGPLLSLALVGFLVLVAPEARAKLEITRVMIRTSMLILAVVVIVFAVYSIENFASISIVTRIAESLGDDSTNERVGLIRAALDQFADHPILGSASVELESGNYPHNMFVEGLMIGGIPTTILLSVFVFMSSRAAFHLWKQGRGARWLSLLLVQYFVGMLFSGSVLLDGRFWALAMAAMALDSVRGDTRACAVPRGRTSNTV